MGVRLSLKCRGAGGYCIVGVAAGGAVSAAAIAIAPL